VLIDLTATNFVDSTVLGLIFDLVRAGDTADGAARVAVVAVPGSAADRIITLSGWTRFVNAVHETKEHALRALRTER